MRDSKKILIKLTEVIFFGLLFMFVYFNKLGSNPPGFYIDEALPAYNAYSLLKTGLDEWGKQFPIVFRFFRFYNPPLFTYLLTVPIYFLGLNIFAVRVLSVASGLGVVVVYYFLLKSSKLIKTSFNLFWVVAFFSISPWLVFYSRIGFEVMLAFFLFTLGIFFFWRFIKKRKHLVTSYLFLSMSTYVSYTQRILVPLFVVSSMWLFRKYLFRKDKP